MKKRNRLQESYDLMKESMKDAMDLYVIHADRKGDSWRDVTMYYLERKLHEEYGEYIVKQTSSDNDRKELLDIINVAAMLAARLKLYP